MTNKTLQSDKQDFFISRAGVDAEAAKQIAQIIRGAGRTPFYQDEHFGHADFMRRMEQGLESGARVVALLSTKYQESEFCRKEYNTILSTDPANHHERLIVLRIEDCAPTGSLTTLAFTDLVPALGDWQVFQQVVRSALGFDTSRPMADFSLAFRRDGRKIRHNDIRPVRGFAGRRDLLGALRAKLSRGAVAIRNSSETTLALRGLGGVGKTVLATQYAWENKDDYCGLWWVRSETRETILEDLGALGSCMGLADVGIEPEKAAKLTLDCIAQTRTGKPWLLIYDNADDQSLLRELTPADNAHVLITTRLTDWHGEVEELAVDVFDLGTAVEFLLDQARNKAKSRKAAARLAEALDRLPLALAHARSYCWGRNWNFDRYIKHLPELIRRVPPNAAYPASVFATFSLAIERANENHPGAESLMSLFAFLAADQIPLWLVANAEPEPLAFTEAIAALAGVSLVNMDTLESGSEAVSVHRLVQRVMRARVADRGETEAAATLVGRMVESGYDDTNSFASLTRNREWYPHALEFLTHAPRTGAGAWHTIWTYIQVGDFSASRGETSASLMAYRAAQGLADELVLTAPDADPGGVRWQRELSVSHNKIGDALVDHGSLSEALASYRAAMTIRKRFADANPDNAGWQRDLVVSHEKIGDVLRRQVDLPEALRSYRAAMAVAQRLAAAAPGDPGMERNLSVLHEKIGGVLRLHGNFSEALKNLQNSKAIRERLATLDPANAGWQRDLSVAHNMVGDVFRDQGRLADALKSYEASRVIAQRLADSDPGNAGWRDELFLVHEKICHVHRLQGNSAEALAN